MLCLGRSKTNPGYIHIYELSRVLQGQVLESVRESGGVGPVHEVLRDMLRGVQVRAVGDVWEQARVPLLQGQAQLQGHPQMPLAATYKFH